MRPFVDISPAEPPEQKNQLAAAYRAISPLLQPDRDKMAETQKQLDKLEIVTAKCAAKEKQSLRAASTAIHARGASPSPTDKVYADVPSALGHLPANQMPNRLGLANWPVATIIR